MNVVKEGCVTVNCRLTWKWVTVRLSIKDVKDLITLCLERIQNKLLCTDVSNKTFYFVKTKNFTKVG